jgi:acetyl-CoA synthetase
LAQLKDKIQFLVYQTRSAKNTRRILRKIAEGDYFNFGDTNLLNPEIVDEIKDGKI